MLLTVNVDDTVLNATWTFEPRLASVAPMFEDRDPLAVTREHSFSDRYEPFDVHVYRIQ